MRKYLLPRVGKFYKANLHCHTTISDGRRTPEEIKELYKSHGYSIVAYTDHDIMIPHHDLDDEDFLALTGYEMEISQTDPSLGIFKKTAHICLISKSREPIDQVCYHREKYLVGGGEAYRHLARFDDTLPNYERQYLHRVINDIINKGREGGFFVTYNHPTWSGENYSDYMGYHGMNAMEIYNGGCIAAGYDDINLHEYDDILRGGERIYAIGADDNHNAHPDDSRHTDSAIAWTMIKAPDLDYKAVTSALERGHFYASMGPEIKALYVEDGVAYIKTSPADRIVMTTGGRRRSIVYREAGKTLTGARFKIPADAYYVRFTVYDKYGKRADTNAYFVDEIL